MKTLLGFALLGLAAVWISCSSNASPVSPSASKALTDDGTGSTATTNVAFTDANLEAAVRAALGTNAPATTDSLNTAHLQLLTVLDGRDRNIQSLAGLQHATALDTLNLTKNLITDVTPLASLTNLKALSLTQNSITDLQPLASLTNLKRLEVTQNSITDLQPLASLTNLEYLEVASNWITNVTPLASLTNLEYLDLQRNRIARGSVGVSSLAGLVNLEVLSLYQQGGGFSLSSLTGLTKLKVFEIGDGEFRGKVGPLVANMPDLERLKVNGCNLENIDFLDGLPKLEHLNISNNSHVTDLKPLVCLPELETLIVRRMPIIYNGSVYSVHIQYLVDNGVEIISAYNP